MLFGVEGLQVTDAQALPDGTLEVWAVTDYRAAAACPDCGTVSARQGMTRCWPGRGMSAGPVTRRRRGGSSRAYIAVADHVDGRLSPTIPVDLLGPDLGLI